MQKPYRPYQRLKIIEKMGKFRKVECAREGRRVNVLRCMYCGSRVGGGNKQVFCDFIVKYRTHKERYT